MATIWTPGTDWGSYLYWNTAIQFDWEKLVEAGILFCVHKSDQEQIDPVYGNYSTLRNMQDAKNRGVLVNGTYSWLFPHVNQKYWIDNYKKATEREKPDFISVDAEQTSWVDDQGTVHVPPPSQVAENLLALCEGYSSAFPELPFLLYTRPDWIKTYAFPAMPYLKWEYFMAGWPDWGSPVYELPLSNLVASDMRQVLTYNPVTWRMVNLIRDGFEPSKVKPSDVVRIWQTSSRILPVYAGKTEPAYHQYDWNFFFGDKDALLAWAKKPNSGGGGGGGEVTPPPEGGIVSVIPNKLVAQADRAKIVHISSTQKPAPGIGYKGLGADAVILDGGGIYFREYDMEGNKKTFAEMQTSFPARCEEASVSLPVLAEFVLDAGACLKGGWTAGMIEASVQENVVIDALIDMLHDGTWTWASLGTNPKWRKVSGIVFRQTEDEGYYGVVPEIWQLKIFEEIIGKTLTLMDLGVLPKLPVILYTHDWFVQMYNGVYKSKVEAWADKIYLMLDQQVRTSESIFNNLGEIFAFPPDDSFAWSILPDGYFDKTLMHEFCYYKQGCRTVIDSLGKPSRVRLSVWKDIKEKMYEFLKFVPDTTTPPPGGGGGGNPPPEPGVDLTAVLAKLDELMVMEQTILSRINSIFK